MKRTPSKGSKQSHHNTVKTGQVEMNDDPRRHQPPTPQDIAKVQKISQNNHTDHPGKNTNSGK